MSRSRFTDASDSHESGQLTPAYSGINCKRGVTGDLQLPKQMSCFSEHLGQKLVSDPVDTRRFPPIPKTA